MEQEIRSQDTIILGYPTQFSNAPFMVRDFIKRNAFLWKGKKCTMCYRCISHCPKMAITLIGDEVKEQCQFEKYS